MVQILIQNLSECHIVSHFMSHSTLRQEQTCLNCGQNVHDRFCSYCGQENREPHETFWSLLIHFIEDIFHYDGKLFTTIKQLFLKPGYLSSEYLRGKRTVYLHPIRFYLFTSAFFFISLFYVFHPLEKRLSHEPENSSKKELSDPVIAFKNGFMQDQKANPKTFEDYKKLQDKLPEAKRDSEFEQKLVKQVYAIGNEYKNSEDLLEALVDTMLHKMSTLLFIALPLLAFILQLLFIRRKGFYYMHHGIFILHMATSYFITLFFVEVVGIVKLLTSWAVVGQISGWLIFAWFVYYLFAFKRFYQLTWPKAMIYYAFAVLMQQILLAFIFIGLLIFSFFSL